jgi:hypothetical protein
LTNAERGYSRSRRSREEPASFFDKEAEFVLDTTKFSSIIYILYEGAGLSLPMVTSLGLVARGRWVDPQGGRMAKKTAKAGAKKKTAKKR